MNSREIMKKSDTYIMNTYARFPVAFVRGEGCYLWDAEGKKYLDLLSGVAVNGLGHSHPEISEVICRQAKTLMHTSNLFYGISQANLAERLCELSFADRVFFSNSGAEANEAAVKLARAYGKKNRGPDCYEILTAERSFHGRTLAMVAATGQEKIKQGFDPFLQGFRHVPFNDLAALEAAIGPQTCAIMLEPVQGEGGVNLPAPEFLREVRALCDRHGLLMILDEIQTGLGRTGTLFAYEHAGVSPDIMSLAKALGAGLPIGACLATQRVADAFWPGAHASTFGGNFLACEVAKKNLEILLEGGVLAQVPEKGAYFLEGLKSIQKDFSVVRQVRGMGLILGMDLDIPGRPLVEAGLQRGVVLNCVQDTTLRFLPPLVIEREQIDEGLALLREVLATVEAS